MHYCNTCGERGHMAAESHCGVCGVHPAPHKIGEEGFGPMYVHNMTAYLCCEHFGRIVGNCEMNVTYAHPERSPWAFRSYLGPSVDTSTHLG